MNKQSKTIIFMGPITIHKIFETNSSFYVKWRTKGKIKVMFSKRLLLVLTKFSSWQECWALGYHLLRYG